MTPLSPDETGVAVAHMVSTLESLYSITHSLETGLTKHREALNKDPKCRHEVDEMDSTLIPLYVARDSLQVSFYLLSLARNRLLSP
ncbi:hypothetical protein [Spirillospora sp. NPDC047279]|uniref:hypothetical protein n=1 Tax=Spirillospora sp. NPDC047279 TaxID=3155478 RepID=UPI0033D275D4